MSPVLIPASTSPTTINEIDSLNRVYSRVEERLADRIRETDAALASKQTASAVLSEFSDVTKKSQRTRDQILALPARARAAQANISPRSALALLT